MDDKVVDSSREHPDLRMFRQIVRAATQRQVPFLEEEGVEQLVRDRRFRRSAPDVDEQASASGNEESARPGPGWHLERCKILVD